VPFKYATRASPTILACPNWLVLCGTQTRVVESEQIGPDPLARRMLADMRAEVMLITPLQKGDLSESLGDTADYPMPGEVVRSRSTRWLRSFAMESRACAIAFARQRPYYPVKRGGQRVAVFIGNMKGMET